MLSESVAHGGNEVLAWMAGNAVPREDEDGNIKISRKRSLEKIDGIAALIMALNQALIEPKKFQSAYDSDDWEEVMV